MKTNIPFKMNKLTYESQFSEIGYNTTFENENDEFLRFDGRSKNRFNLNTYPDCSIKKGSIPNSFA